jgi:uncharacterized protein
VPLGEGIALYNASTGSVLRLDGPDADGLSALLAGDPVMVPGDLLGPATDRLRRAGFLVDPDEDEVATVRERYLAARGHAPVSLVVTTTMDCNLGCYYCFESRTGEALSVANVPGLVELAAQRLARRGKTSLHVDWYGGEPLLGAEFLESASTALQEYCAAHGVRYHASVVSNGTRWPDDVGEFVARHRIRQVQISFDGMADNHDRRRRFRPGFRRQSDVSSFAQAAGLVDQLLLHTRVDLRFNADRGNAGDLPDFVRFARDRGWFDAPFRCVATVAKLSAYSDRSSFLRPHELTPEVFDELEATLRALLPASARDDQDLVGGLPHPRTSVCGALAPDSAVIGADGLEYRCGLQVGERHRAVGRAGRQLLPLVSTPGDDRFADRGWWEAFDPTTLPTCSRCSFLPVCWGGCPKRHLDGTPDDTAAEGRYWRHNLPRMILDGLGETTVAAEPFAEADQFRALPLQAYPADPRSDAGAARDRGV